MNRLGTIMTLPISSLANMEYALYGGGLTGNPNCPSYSNGYVANNYSMGFRGQYPYYSQQQYQQTNQNNYANYPQQNGYYSQFINQAQNNTQQSIQKSLDGQTFGSQKDWNTLADFYKKENTYVQKWGELGTSALMIGFTEHPQTMKHFFNSIKSIKPTDAIFNLKDPAIKALWEKNPELMQKAYGKLHAINRAASPKWGVVQKWFSKPMDEGSRKMLEEMMEKALKSGDEKAILKAAETLDAARGMDGYIPTAWNKIKGFMTGKDVKNLTPAERIVKKTAEIEKAVNAPAAIKPGVGGLLKQGLKEGKTFALFGMLIDLPKMITAYKEGGVGSLLTQMTQTGVRSVADGIGWTVGRAAGTALGTKAGAALGTLICPGVGTAVGAALGFIGGAAGSILASKITHAFIKTDEATKLEAEKHKKTEEGRTQLLTLVTDKVNRSEAVPQEVLQSAQNIAIQMSS